MTMSRKRKQNKKKKGFRMPYGYISLGAVFAILYSPFSPNTGMIIFISILVLIYCFIFAGVRGYCEADMRFPWWCGGL